MHTYTAGDYRRLFDQLQPSDEFLARTAEIMQQTAPKPRSKHKAISILAIAAAFVLIAVGAIWKSGLLLPEPGLLALDAEKLETLSITEWDLRLSSLPTPVEITDPADRIATVQALNALRLSDTDDDPGSMDGGSVTTLTLTYPEQAPVEISVNGSYLLDGRTGTWYEMSPQQASELRTTLAAILARHRETSDLPTETLLLIDDGEHSASYAASETTDYLFTHATTRLAALLQSGTDGFSTSNVKLRAPTYTIQLQTPKLSGEWQLWMNDETVMFRSAEDDAAGWMWRLSPENSGELNYLFARSFLRNGLSELEPYEAQYAKNSPWWFASVFLEDWEALLGENGNFFIEEGDLEWNAPLIHAFIVRRYIALADRMTDEESDPEKNGGNYVTYEKGRDGYTYFDKARYEALLKEYFGDGAKLGQEAYFAPEYQAYRSEGNDDAGGALITEITPLESGGSFLTFETTSVRSRPGTVPTVKRTYTFRLDGDRFILRSAEQGAIASPSKLMEIIRPDGVVLSFGKEDRLSNGRDIAEVTSRMLSLLQGGTLPQMLPQVSDDSFYNLIFHTPASDASSSTQDSLLEYTLWVVDGIPYFLPAGATGESILTGDQAEELCGLLLLLTEDTVFASVPAKQELSSITLEGPGTATIGTGDIPITMRSNIDEYVEYGAAFTLERRSGSQWIEVDSRAVNPMWSDGILPGGENTGTISLYGINELLTGEEYRISKTFTTDSGKKLTASFPIRFTRAQDIERDTVTLDRFNRDSSLSSGGNAYVSILNGTKQAVTVDYALLSDRKIGDAWQPRTDEEGIVGEGYAIPAHQQLLLAVPLHHTEANGYSDWIYPGEYRIGASIDGEMLYTEGFPVNNSSDPPSTTDLVHVQWEPKEVYHAGDNIAVTLTNRGDTQLRLGKSYSLERLPKTGSWEKVTSTEAFDDIAFTLTARQSMTLDISLSPSYYPGGLLPGTYRAVIEAYNDAGEGTKLYLSPITVK